MSLLFVNLFLTLFFGSRGESIVPVENPLAEQHDLNISEQWIPTLLAEKGCHHKHAHFAIRLDEDFIDSVEVWHIPMASRHFVAYFSHLLLRRILKTQESSDACFRWVFLGPESPEGNYTNVVSAFGRWIFQDCIRTDYLTQNCTVVETWAPDDSAEWDELEEETEQKHYRYEPTASYTVEETDNVSWILFIRCFSNGVKDWAVFSKKDNFSLDQTSRNKISVLLAKLGFDIRYLWNADVKNCQSKSFGAEAIEGGGGGVDTEVVIENGVEEEEEKDETGEQVAEDEDGDLLLF